MADIALRTYLQEIDELVNHSQSDEAIAHTKHILGFYPKLLEAYRLWAKALLERQKHIDAADIFQRVLSSVPDDFISHVGMSIVREDEGNLDAAIWHMERAFESQPGSSDIQAELKRLYGKRDGLEPPKVRLTRAALARLYEKGDHYPQALAELRAALAEEPDRIDLKVLMAQTHWHARQRAEAAELSAKILETLPYCREANRILASIWAEQGQKNESEVYSKKVEMLDPYEAFADPSENGQGAANAPAESISLPKLDYVPSADASLSEPAPDWMETLDKRQEETTATTKTGTTGKLSSRPDEVPDWLAEAPLTAEAAPTATPAEIPDWLKDQAGSAKAATSPLPSPESKATPAPEEDWLNAISDPNAAQQAPAWIDEAAPAQNTSGAGWLNDLFGEGQAAPSASEPATTGGSQATDWMQSEEPAADEDLPDWMKPAPEAEAPTTPPADSQDVATVVETESSAPTVIEPAAAEPAMAEPTTGDDDLPDWLKAPAPTERTGLTTWLSHLPTEMPPASEPTAATTAGMAETTASAAGSPSFIPESETPTASAEISSAITEGPASPAEMAATGEATNEAVELSEEQIPEWMKVAGWTLRDPSIPLDSPTDFSEDNDYGESDPMATDETAAPGDMPDWLKAMKPPTPDPEAEKRKGGDAAPDWLRNVMEGGSEPSPAPEAAPLPAAEAGLPGATPLETPSLETSPAEAGPSATEALASMFSDSAPAESMSGAQPSAEADLPDWLKGSATPEQPKVRKDTGELFFEKLETGEFDKLQSSTPPTPAERSTLEPTGAAAPLLDNPDDALAWLESLALKQGANPEEMVSKPEARAEAELPEWLRLPAEETPTQLPETLSQPEAELPDWLRPPAEATLEPVTTPAAETAPAATMPADDADAALAWLESLALKQGANPEEMVTNAPAQAEMPEWLRQPSEEEPTAAGPESISPEPTAELPDWRRSPVEARSRAEAAAQSETPASAEPTTPEWLRPPASEPEFVEPTPAVMAKPALDDTDAALAWLESLALKQGANPEEMVSKPETRTEEMPDWLKPTPAVPPIEESPVTLTASAGSTMATPPAEEKPDWLKQMEAESDAYEAMASGVSSPTAPGASTVPAEPMMATPPAEEKPGWLKHMEAEADAYEALVTKPLPPLPDWAQPKTAESEAEPTPGTESPPPVAEEKPDWLKQMEVESDAYKVSLAAPAQPESATPADDDADAALAWLESLAMKQGANPEELISEPTARSDDMPDWLKTESPEVALPEEIAGAPAGAGQPEIPVESPTVTEEEALAWLESSKSEDAQAETPEWMGQQPAAAASGEPQTVQEWLRRIPGGQMEADLPEWLQQHQAIEPPAPEPTVSLPSSEDEALAWLESLAARQGANPDELISSATARTDEAPEWVKLSAEATPAPETGPAESESGIIVPVVPDWLNINPVTSVVTERPAVADSVPEAITPMAAPAAEPEPAPVAALVTPAPKPKQPRLPKPPKAARPKKGKLRGGEQPEAVLSKAREHLRDAQFDQAIERYAVLIAAGLSVPEAITDLESANKRNPAQPELMRTLGDAYLKDNQLQNALDVYRLALQQL